MSSSSADFDPADDLVFLHHSSGEQWLARGLHEALLAKPYIDERNDISVDADLVPDPGRPASVNFPWHDLSMSNWIRWFNDYLQGVKAYGSSDGINRIIMFKSCYTINIGLTDGSEPGDPFSYDNTVTNFKAVYRHPGGPGNIYVWNYNGYAYKPLEDIFAENPDILFIAVTAPPRHYAPEDGTTDADAHRARVFNNWLVGEWLPSYSAAHPGLNNVAVFDWFDFLAYADDAPLHPNRLKEEYGGASGNSHPNATADLESTQVFATNPENFIDTAWNAFLGVPIQGKIDLSPSRITPESRLADYGDQIIYDIVIRNSAGPLTDTVLLTDTVPAGLRYVPGTLDATSGNASDMSLPTLLWSGTLSPTPSVTVTYAVTVVTTQTVRVSTTAELVARSEHYTLEAKVYANPYRIYLPVVLGAGS